MNQDAQRARQQLRAGTAQQHALLDAHFPDGLADAAAYRCYLAGMHRICTAVENAWIGHGDDASARTNAAARTTRLREDMACVGVGALHAGSSPLALHGEAELAGAEYVIQGSRYGARQLLRQVQAQGWTAQRGASFLHAHAAADGEPRWNALLARIGEYSTPGGQLAAEVMDAAARTFAAAASAFGCARPARNPQ